jgi:hypothetical protein
MLGFLVYILIMFFPFASLSAVHIASSILGALFLLNFLSVLKMTQILRTLTLNERRVNFDKT